MFDAIERGLYWLSSVMLEGDADAHCQLRAPVSDDTFSTTSDDLLSVVEILGARQLIGASEFESLSSNLANILAGVLKSGNGKQHSFGLAFRSDPESVDRLLKEMLGPTINTARRLGADRTDLYFMDQLKALGKRCAEESAYLVVLTHPSGLSPADRQRALKWREQVNTKLSKATGGARIHDSFAQNPRSPAPALFPRHAAMLTNLTTSLEAEAAKGGAGLLVRVLDCEEAVMRMRRHQEAFPFPSTWRPRLLGAPGQAAVNLPRKGDASHLMPMRIGRQMIAEKLEESFDDVEIAKRGSFHYASLVMEVPPETGSERFSDLSDRIGHEIPWTLSVELVGEGLKTRQLDNTFSGFVGALGDHNKKIRQAWNELRAMHNNGVYVGAVRMIFTTWAKDRQRCIENYSFLRSSLESWGSTVVTNETGSPALAALCSAAGFSKRSPAPYLPGPLAEFARMMPFFRPASIWTSGQLIAHTREGRPYPVKFGSPEQSFWGTLIFAPSGSGKSFLMSMINAGILLSPGLSDLPYLTVVDVGPSSRLVMDLIRSTVPDRLKRQVQSIRIRNDKKYAVNPWDTQLGCDRPTAVDKDFQISVLSTLAPSLGKDGEKFIGQVIDMAYDLFSRQSPRQKVWQSSLDAHVSSAIAEIGMQVTEKTRVWDVVDALFEAGRAEDASLAQRYAVPTLGDMVTAARQKNILDLWETAPAESGESVIEVFCRSVLSGMNEYRLINGTTQFDVGSARALSIDLEEVISADSSEEGRRRAAMMFLFARRLGAKNYFLRWDELEAIVPPAYYAYQENRVKDIYASLKFLEYDEKHYTTGIATLDRQIQQDLRVGRKYNTVTIMASQLIEDFPRAAVENCYSYFILGTGTSGSVDELANVFGLTESEANAIEKQCTGPGKLFAMFKTNKGTTSQVLHTTAGAYTQWAFLTSPGDKDVRAEVVERVGGAYWRAVEILAKAFPTGTARREMDAYRQKMGDDALAGGRTIVEVFADLAMERAGAGAGLDAF
jgi:intracellular multiplication protein IcmB